MALSARVLRASLWTQRNAIVLFARLFLYFALQGVAILVAYAVLGFETSPDSLPPGFRLDPRHAVVHLAWGLAGSYVGFWRPAAAVLFARVFSVFYLALAVFGTFTSIHFGMQLKLPENGLHWSLGLIALVIGFVLPQRLAARRA